MILSVSLVHHFSFSKHYPFRKVSEYVPIAETACAVSIVNANLLNLIFYPWAVVSRYATQNFQEVEITYICTI